MKKLLKKIAVITFVFILTIMPTASAYAATIVSPAVKWSKAKYYQVNVSSGSTLNARSGPGTSYSIIGYLNDNDLIVCDGQDSSGTWYHMPERAFKQNEAWVSASYLDFLQNVD
jgi:uncharacterized protein YraI